MKEFFITGTDTGIGKTTVSVALLAAAARLGHSTAALKPAESGCARSQSGELRPADAQALLEVSTTQCALDDICCYRFEDPVAPGVAAARTGQPIEFDRIELLLENARSKRPDILVIEGAGGLLVPLTPSQTIADLAQRLQLPLLLVARAGLGTINHTRLTLEAVQSRGLEVAGLIFSCATQPIDELSIVSNAEEITKAHPIPYLGCLPYLRSPNIDQLANAAEDLVNALL